MSSPCFLMGLNVEEMTGAKGGHSVKMKTSKTGRQRVEEEVQCLAVATQGEGEEGTEGMEGMKKGGEDGCKKERE